jgi:2-polyprenyl-6-hydroxyphenyl methylase / 3-demethylubiquinone-9 3-methyltransferase
LRIRTISSNELAYSHDPVSWICVVRTYTSGRIQQWIEDTVSLTIDRTIDPAELAHYEAAAPDWWNNRSVARWLHKYNVVRVPYIRDAACRQFTRDPRQLDCLSGLRILDVGCGGGVLCEPLAQLGATVVGLDPARTAIGVAKRHAIEAGISVEYRCDTIEKLVEAGEVFDVVLAMEVIEHVANIEVFLDRCAELVRPGGLVILSTINRTAKSWAFAIAMGEYVLRLLPRGSHQWRKFVRPDEIRSALETKLFRVVDVRGVTMNLRSRLLQLSNDASVNYMLTAGLPRG